jgi:esterase/lipase superfamily enzyme
MEEKGFNESNDEMRARGVKRTSDAKIAEVSTSKKKRAKKPPVESPEPAQVQINFNDQEEQSEESAKHFRMFRSVKDVAEGEISIEELTVALNNAVRSRHLRLIAQGAFHNVPEEPRVIELNMEAFNRSV